MTAGIDAELLRRGPFVLIRSGHETCRRCDAPLPPPAMRRRIRELLGYEPSDALDLCAACQSLSPNLRAEP